MTRTSDTSEQSGEAAPTERYIIVDESLSNHCCFSYTVCDTERPLLIGGEPWYERGKLRYETVCECFEEEDAVAVCRAMNAAVKRPAAEV